MPILHLLLLFLSYSSCLAAIDNATSSRRLSSSSSARATKTTIFLRTTKQQSHSSNTTNGLHRAISGGLSRAIAQAALYPLDALRTLSQTRDSRTLANIGIRSLLNGCLQTSTFALLTGASQFGMYSLCCNNYGCSPLAASVYGAAGSCIFSVPQEVIKQRLITGVYTNFRTAIVQIWKTEGISGYYSGWRPTMSRNIPFVIVTFASRDSLHSGLVRFKKRHQRRRNKNNNHDSSSLSSTVLEDVGVGIASALIACLLTQPIDVVKTRIMTQAASNAIPYTSALDCATSILRTEGWKRLYSGIGKRGLYMGGLWGITFGFEPILTKYLGDT